MHIKTNTISKINTGTNKRQKCTKTSSNLTSST